MREQTRITRMEQSLRRVAPSGDVARVPSNDPLRGRLVPTEDQLRSDLAKADADHATDCWNHTNSGQCNCGKAMAQMRLGFYKDFLRERVEVLT